MYKIPANTLFIGKNIVFVPECHSTNNLASELCQKTSVAEGTVVITHHQTSGRGQRGTQWISDPGKNLICSIILKPLLAPAEQFALTMVISLAVHDLLTSFIPKGIAIKWPNDLLVENKKICGILIENALAGNRFQHCIVGIGLNINQHTFSISTATSLAIETNNEYNLEEIFHSLLNHVEARYLQLKAGKQQMLKTDYTHQLYKRGERHGFVSLEGEWEGVIETVDERGRLVVSSDKGTRTFDLKEIQFRN